MSAALILGFIPSSAYAKGTVSVDGNVTLVSDYRFRGISASERKPGLQASIDAIGDSGVTAGATAYTIAEYSGSNVELDLYAGMRRKVGKFDVELRAYAFVFPGGKNTDTFDAELTVAHRIGAGTIETLLAFSPKQVNASHANIYIAETLTVPIAKTPLTARFHAGFEDGLFRSKWDWGVGLSYSVRSINMSVSYVDTNYGDQSKAGINGRAGVVSSVRLSF